jgi:hypothetical protein
VRLVWRESVIVEREVELQLWPASVRRELCLQSATRWSMCRNLHDKRHSEQMIAVLRFEDALAKARVLLWPWLVGVCNAEIFTDLARRCSALHSLS